MLCLVLVGAGLLQGAIEEVLTLSAVGVYVVYSAVLLLPGDKLRDCLGNAIRAQAAAEGKYRELVGKSQALPCSGALLDLDVGAQRISRDHAVLGTLEVFLSVCGGEQDLVRLLRQHSGRHSRVGVALVCNGLYSHRRRLTKNCSGDVAAGADNDIRLEFPEYFAYCMLCRKQVQIRSLCVPADILY